MSIGAGRSGEERRVEQRRDAEIRRQYAIRHAKSGEEKDRDNQRTEEE